VSRSMAECPEHGEYMEFGPDYSCPQCMRAGKKWPTGELPTSVLASRVPPPQPEPPPSKSMLKRISTQLFDHETGKIRCPKCAEYEPTVTYLPEADKERMRRWHIATYHLNHS